MEAVQRYEFASERRSEFRFERNVKLERDQGGEKCCRGSTVDSRETGQHRERRVWRMNRGNLGHAESEAQTGGKAGGSLRTEHAQLEERFSVARRPGSDCVTRIATPRPAALQCRRHLFSFRSTGAGRKAETANAACHCVCVCVPRTWAVSLFL